MEPRLEPNKESHVTLFRAVGLNAANDLESVNRFRLHRAPGFVAGKWFATTQADALRWGRKMQDFSDPRPFRIASVLIPHSVLADIDFVDRLDGIGPAYFVHITRLTTLNRAATITVLPTIYRVEAIR
jgi:hypothetical protein